VAVVGAGLAGLAAGLELRAAGARVEVFERGRLLGGRATSFVVDGVEVDNGQHVFLGCCDEFVDLVVALGLGDRLRLQERFDVVVCSSGDGRRRSRLRAADLPAPWHLAAGFLRYGELGWLDRLRVARTLLRTASRREDRQPFASWLDRCGQTPASRRAFWEPFFVPALNAPLDEMTVAEAAFVIETAFLSGRGAARFGWLDVPLARLAEAAAARLDAVHLRAPVVALEHASGPAAGSGAVTGLRTADGRWWPFDGVVAAVPPDRLGRLLCDPVAAGLGAPEGFVSRPIVDVHLWHEGGADGPDFAALLDSPVQWVFRKAPGYLCCSLSSAGSLVERPEAELVERCWAEVARALPHLAGARLLRGAATRNPEATWAALPGVRRPGPATAAPNLAIAGSWTDTGWPDTMESAVRSGRRGARHLLPAIGLDRSPGTHRPTPPAQGGAGALGSAVPAGLSTVPVKGSAAGSGTSGRADFGAGAGGGTFEGGSFLSMPERVFLTGGSGFVGGHVLLGYRAGPVEPALGAAVAWFGANGFAN
jgi:squalene-associated FAD-dependent desaturase